MDIKICRHRERYRRVKWRNDEKWGEKEICTWESGNKRNIVEMEKGRVIGGERERYRQEMQRKTDI